MLKCYCSKIYFFVYCFLRNRIKQGCCCLKEVFLVVQLASHNFSASSKLQLIHIYMDVPFFYKMSIFNLVVFLRRRGKFDKIWLSPFIAFLVLLIFCQTFSYAQVSVNIRSNIKINIIDNTIILLDGNWTNNGIFETGNSTVAKIPIASHLIISLEPIMSRINE